MTTRDTVTVIRNLVGDQFMYAYSPGDRRGTRYVFHDETKIGRAAALKYAEHLAAHPEIHINPEWDVIP